MLVIRETVALGRPVRSTRVWLPSGFGVVAEGAQHFKPTLERLRDRRPVLVVCFSRGLDRAGHGSGVVVGKFFAHPPWRAETSVGPISRVIRVDGM